MNHPILYVNEMAKRRYFAYLKNSQGFSNLSIVNIEKSLWLWQEFTEQSDFKGFHQQRAIGFKEWLKNKKKHNSLQKNVSLSFCYDMLRYLRAFFEWLATQPGYKSKIRIEDIGYLGLTKQENRLATLPSAKKLPSLEEVRQTIEAIQPLTEVDRRDKALLSLAFLTGARVSALASLPLQSFDKERLTVDQNPKFAVKTKFSKRIVSALIPFSYREPLDYFTDWIDYLDETKKFLPTQPIFPATKKENGQEILGYYSTGEVEPIFWKSTSSVRKIFEKRFKDAGLPYYHPHTFRHLLVKEISKIPLTEEQKKAISQNLGHEDVGTTFGSYGYGAIGEDRQIELVRAIQFDGKSSEVKYLMSQEQIAQIALQAAQQAKIIGT